MLTASPQDSQGGNDRAMTRVSKTVLLAPMLCCFLMRKIDILHTEENQAIQREKITEMEGMRGDKLHCSKNKFSEI